ncbi:hypothetical protein OAE13_03975 [Flavobacteriaceae bacterium]|nr:hypothetical protein [Flavobacteriaceae bacterium]
MNTENNSYVETESSLIRKYKNLLLENRDAMILDLGEPIPIFKWFISEKSTWESKTVMSNTVSLLNKIAAAYKEFPDDTVCKMLTVAAKRMRDISKGGMISNEGYKSIIQEAIDFKESTEVVSNAEIRYLKNPYYIWSKDDVPFKKKIYREFLNKCIAEDTVDKNYEKIEIALADYDFNQKKITYNTLSDITELHRNTIRKYLNENLELQEMFDVIKKNSSTEKQRKDRIYNDLRKAS